MRCPLVGLWATYSTMSGSGPRVASEEEAVGSIEIERVQLAFF
jgi:hypothetical protein